MYFSMVFVFTQFWVDGCPGSTYFWITQIVPNLLAPLEVLGLYPQWFQALLSNSSLSIPNSRNEKIRKNEHC